MRIVILHDTAGEKSAPDEADVLLQAESVAGALAGLGHETISLACGLNLEALQRDILRLSPDLVFNLVESLNGRGRLIHAVPFLLDSEGIPFTGASSEAIYATSNKITAKERMGQWNILTPAWVGPYSLLKSGHIRLNPAERVSSPAWIVKSVWEHASIGLDDGAVFHPDCMGDIMDCLGKRATDLGGDCFAERFIQGREFNLSLLEINGRPVVLPPAEIIFEGYREDQIRIVGYQAKWDQNSFEYHHTPRRFDFPETDLPLLKKLEKMALESWGLFCLNGYARVDFRVDEDDIPWVLEVNTNPCIAPDAGFAAALERAGISYKQAVEDIIKAALTRVGKPAVSAPKKPRPPQNLPGNAAPTFRYQAVPDDKIRVHDLLSATGFFHHDEIDMAVELIEENLVRGAMSGYTFVFFENPSRLIGYTCFGPIPCTQSGYDIYWIAVHPDFQGQNHGRQLMAETERLIAQAGGRQVYVDTSGRPQYEPTRRFYERCGYESVSVLPDFYAPDDDKVIFRKMLAE